MADEAVCDPTGTLAARLRSGSPSAKKLLDEEHAHAAVNAGDKQRYDLFRFMG
jgi:RNA:NAD 2'-phosphotransferase (TPT1/KptA family)